MLGLSALIAGDFVFLPSDTRICKAMQPTTSNISLTLFLRVRFFLPSLRGLRSTQTRHLLYLQLRRSILEHQLPCSFTQLVQLNGLALQAEFGDYNERVREIFSIYCFNLKFSRPPAPHIQMHLVLVVDSLFSHTKQKNVD